MLVECPRCGYHYWESVGCPNGCTVELVEPAQHIPQHRQSESVGGYDVNDANSLIKPRLGSFINHGTF
jgi:hypothetical protein